MGDPAGIGPDIALMAWARRTADTLPSFAIYADPATLQTRAAQLGLAVPLKEIAAIGEAAEIFSHALPVIPIGVARPVKPGEPDTANACAVLKAIQQAVSDVAAGHAGAVVTNPIAKSVLYQAGFAHPGHTEYLGELARQHWPAEPAQPVMMIASEILRVVPMTIHVPVRDVPGLITRATIIETIRITDAALRRDFGIPHPRIAVTGLNPHAGEDGSLGTEDRDIIEPALLSLKSEGFSVTGPHAADTLFHTAARRTYDAAVAMYHDQALIPIKTLAFDDGVNVTLGLPFVRTSPDHGTAFAIAGTGKASPSSLIAALKLAGAMAARRAAKTHP
jgi:4-hydroxythreonine-4-phosphate dehydrogenase